MKKVTLHANLLFQFRFILLTILFFFFVSHSGQHCLHCVTPVLHRDGLTRLSLELESPARPNLRLHLVKPSALRLPRLLLLRTSISRLLKRAAWVVAGRSSAVISAGILHANWPNFESKCVS